MIKTKWTKVEHRVLAYLKRKKLTDKTLLVAHSGGMDSSVLLHILMQVHPHEQLRVLHFHHGKLKEKSDQSSYRDQAMEQVVNQASQHLASQQVIIKKHRGKILSSEAELREARWKFFKSVQKTEEVILTAHHQDDEFETDLLKLIRGTGLSGLLGFSADSGLAEKPLLDFTKIELEEYAIKSGLTWVEDPTNREDHYFRNWLRNEWLPQLQKKRPGSLASFARSLRNIKLEGHRQHAGDPLEQLPFSNKMGILRLKFQQLGVDQQLRCLNLYLNSLNMKNHTEKHYLEIIKRLDKQQKVFTFTVAQCDWFVNAQRVKAVPRSKK